MKIKVLIVFALVIIVGGVIVIRVSQEKAPPPKKSDFLRNDLKNLDVTDGEKF